MNRSLGSANPSASGFYPRKGSQFKTRYFELVELKILANTQQLNAQTEFQEQAQLRNDSTQSITIRAIETYCNQTISNAPSGNPVATPDQIKSAFLVLNIKTFEFENLIPLGALNRIYSDPANYAPFVQDLFLFDDINQVQWAKSFVQFANGAGDNDPYSFLFGVHYEIFPDPIPR